MEKTKPNTIKALFTNKKKCTTTQNKHKKLEPGLVAFLRYPARKQSGSIFKGKISKGGDK